MIKNCYSKTKKGYTLVEALIYIAVFVAMSLVLVTLILSILETNKKILPLNLISRGATSVLEVISKEIRTARNIDTANSSFSTTVGVLQLNTLDENDFPRTVKFYLDSGIVKMDENGSNLGPLSSADAVVTALIFNLATSTEQDLVKIELDLSAGSGVHQKSEKFYTSVKLRTDN